VGSKDSQTRAAALIAQVARAVHHAHQHGIIHRDLKPANILLTSDGVPKITDFGIAKLQDQDGEQTRTGVILGTPGYIAPEQAGGHSKAVGPAADVYALGAILYELLTGRPPFRAASLIDTLLQVQEREPTRPRSYNRQLDPSLEAICLKCLEKLPEDRYPSAEALAEDLTAYLQGEPVLADGSSRLRVLRALLRETRHTEALARWGEVLLWEAALVLLFCTAFGALKWFGVDLRWLYRGIVAAGCTSLLLPIWWYRLRDKAPLTPLERQVGQVWGVVGVAMGLTVGCRLLLWGEAWRLFAELLLDVGVGFGCTAALLGGSFYVMALVCAFLAVLRYLFPELNPVVYGFVFAAGLFVPGWRYSRINRSRPQGESDQRP
jgi:serine/threonine-protein kinase